MSGSAVLEEEPTQRVERLVIVVQAAVEAIGAGNRKERLRRRDAVHRLIGAAHRGTDPVGARGTPEDAAERPRDNLIVLDIPGVVLEIAGETGIPRPPHAC